MSGNDRLKWIRSACGWSDFSEAVELFGHDEHMVYFENDVSIPGQMELMHGASALYMGRYTSVLTNCMISPMLVIGRHCSISHNVLLGGGRHPMEFLTTGTIPGLETERSYFSDAEQAFVANDTSQFTRIGCDVWIGANVSVLRGRSVGHGACLGAGTVVTKDVPPYAVVVGNPGRVIRFRFSERIVESLLRTRWWTLPPALIKDLPYQDIERCADVLEEMRGG